ncbi:atypical kinase COQ8B, mitochondrial [Anabrus simplex]|uniref:atypical kinase COQ8B, mitochondrial n=1 Tax=Anabrus simplex TaxID=316456 RepID=UPI0035A35CBB
MARVWIQDITGVLRGAQKVIDAMIKHEEAKVKQIWDNSSIKEATKDLSGKIGKGVLEAGTLADTQAFLAKNVSETLQRASMVVEGVKGYVKYAGKVEQPVDEPFITDEELNELNLYQKPEVIDKEIDTNQPKPTFPTDPPTVEGLKLEAQRIISAHKDILEPSMRKDDISVSRNKENLWMEKIVPPVVGSSQGKKHDEHMEIRPLQERKGKTSSWVKTRPSLSSTAKQRKVPSSRISRMASFGSLAAGLGLGTMAEYTRRTLGLNPEPPSVGTALDSVFLSPANAERIVNTLCKVRGAALKIGQVLSIQDNSIISPTMQKAFERVRQSADFMPSWQVEKVLQAEFGYDWRDKVTSFEMKPFAAASIGQVHLAVLPSGQEVAMKIQYPGVAQGINSDISNLVGILKVWNVFPEGFFIDNLVEVAKRELSWEVDYHREAECTKKFSELLKPYPDYLVPRVIDELSTKQIFTTELMEGIPVDKVADLDYDNREHICRLIMQLVLRELFEFRYMQTDPNWSNFLYNPETRKLALLDFGASRSYSKEFMDQYIRIVKGAADGDRDVVLKISRDIGFLTGYESKLMEEAHVDAVMILGEVFRTNKPFDFGGQDMTRRIQGLVPTMIKHRLCPPPEEIYSLHRKLSGVFLLCAKLNVKVNCRVIFDEAYDSYNRSSY